MNTNLQKTIYTAFYTDRSTGKLLKRFDTSGNLTKYQWEKIKQEELRKLTRVRELDPETVKVSDHTAIKTVN